ncbi:acyl carrier protein [Stomatohabitans albus]|uniref:acyl carrier protein n=1 Tax=Stomatohabitans albus TaxID=3110766 RepID=UPI00300DAE23
MSANVEQVINNLLVEKFEIPAENITNDATFESLDLDSLDIVELSMNIEDELEVHITEEEAAKLSTVGDVIELLNSKVN